MRTLVLLIAIFASISICDRALAQGATTSTTPGVAIGAAISVTTNNGPEITGGSGVAPAVWGRVSVPLSPRISLNGLVEVPALFTLHTRHIGSAGYIATVEHRDIVVAPLVGFHSRSAKRVRPVGLIGLGPVFARTSTEFRRFVFGGGFADPGEPFQRNKVLAAFIAGLDVEIGLGRHSSLVVGVNGRKTWRRITRSDEVIGSFTLSPRVGIQFR
ncbi:MAG TPA: hypothetical protein VGQ16_17915 [Vicinamibacterales bacterium]|nr:hypothetical protein [Vicinamibacterales bacterium]